MAHLTSYQKLRIKDDFQLTLIYKVIKHLGISQPLPLKLKILCSVQFPLAKEEIQGLVIPTEWKSESIMYQRTNMVTHLKSSSIAGDLKSWNYWSTQLVGIKTAVSLQVFLSINPVLPHYFFGTNLVFKYISNLFRNQENHKNILRVGLRHTAMHWCHRTDR